MLASKFINLCSDQRAMLPDECTYYSNYADIPCGFDLEQAIDADVTIKMSYKSRIFIKRCIMQLDRLIK